jgi:hypothetical protein
VSRVLIIAALGLMAACTRFAYVDIDTIGPGYTTGGGEWGGGGGITAVVRVYERGGVTVVCGAWTTDRQSVLTVELNEQVVAAASVYIGKTRVAQNLGFMARLAYSDNIAGAQADCVASTVPWQAAFTAAAPHFRFPQMVFQTDSTSGNREIFRQTERPGIIR